MECNCRNVKKGLIAFVIYFIHLSIHLCLLCAGELQPCLESLSKGTGTLRSQATGLKCRPWDQQHPPLTAAPARAELGGCQVPSLIWPRLCWGRKPSQKQVLGSGTGLCCTFFPTGLSLQSAKNIFFCSKINLSSPLIFPPCQKKTKAFCCSSLSPLGTHCIKLVLIWLNTKGKT